MSARQWMIGVCVAWCALGGGRAGAQAADTTQRVDTLSYDDAAAVAFLYNQPATLRATNATTIAQDQTVSGNVAVLDAPVVIGGHVTGRVVVINGDVTLLHGARVDSDLVVTGGTVDGADSTTVGGTIKVYGPRLAYRLEGEQVVALRDESQGLASWFRQWKRRHLRTHNRVVLSSGTYNRVEGLPVILGPTIRQNSGLGPFSVQALGIYRSADHFTWKADNLGYDVQAEMQIGYTRGVAFGAEALDQVAPVETWQLRDSEIGLGSFLLRRDYRDYYNRKGARGYVALRDGTTLSLTLGLGKERWQPRATRDPWTLFRGDAAWRPNPVLDAGTFTLASAQVRYDTRNDRDNPWTGWLITAELEHGFSNHVVLGPASTLVRAPSPDGQPVPVAYTRGVLDLRRYNRLSPESQLNFRLYAGGWLGGDPLPLERRFSLGGPGSLPGYDFRQPLAGEQDVMSCSAGQDVPGTPAQCDRVLLAQVEYRGDLHLHLFGGGAQSGGGWSWTFYHPLQWVVFTDAGRGWLLHAPAGDVGVQDASAFPLSSYKSDVGVGLDAEVLGVFVAKSVTDSKNPLNVVVRLRHRF